MIQLEVISPSSSPTSPSTELLSLASSVPIGTRGLVHIVGRNDMASSQYLGISWVVKDPDGVVVEEYTDWTGWAPFYKEIDPDDDHEFIGGRFDINKEGIYTLAVGLFMNIEAPVMVASYDGALCTTTIEVPPVPPVPPEEKKFPWTPVIIGAGAVIAIAGLAAAKKGVK